MSDATPEAPIADPAATPESAPEAQATQSVEDLPQWARDAITKANREAASYRTKVKELEPQAALAAQLEEASKSEAQRLQEAAEASRRDAEAAKADALRYRLAAKHGIPEEDFDLLGSGTEEQIEARAQRIASYRAATATPPPAGRTTERLRPGASPTDPQSEDDVLYGSLFGGN